MIAELTLSLTAILLYKKTKLRSLLAIALFILASILSKAFSFFLFLALLGLLYEINLPGTYKPLNNSGK